MRKGNNSKYYGLAPSNHYLSFLLTASHLGTSVMCIVEIIVSSFSFMIAYRSEHMTLMTPSRPIEHKEKTAGYF